MTDPFQRTDEELIEDYLEGDADAFRHLIERHHDALLHFLFRLTGNRQMAEDAFQEAFLQVHQSIESFDLTRRFKPWLFTIAANKGRDALRRAGRRSAVSLSHRAGGGDEGDALVDLLQIPLPGPGARIEKEELSRLVQNALDALPPRLREILLLAYFQRLTYNQIAEQFAIPVGTVKSRLHAAVAAFARQWKEQAEAAESDREARREQAP
jgi:RNA polymerase sigma-70 factor (ECF subfamily)